MEVFINRNDEAGMLQFSVCQVSDPEFWIDSFPALAQALQFIEREGFTYDPVTGFTNTVSQARRYCYNGSNTQEE